MPNHSYIKKLHFNDSKSKKGRVQMDLESLHRIGTRSNLPDGFE